MHPRMCFQRMGFSTDLLSAAIALLAKDRSWVPGILFSTGLLFFGSFDACGQWTGGRATYAFLNLPSSARVSALGGQLISVADDDVSLAEGNPALLNPGVHQQLAFHHSFLAGGVQHGYAAYGRYVEKWRLGFHTGIKYINYGTLKATNEFFQELGEVEARENALLMGISFQLDERLRAGVNARFISSALGTLESVGISSDLGLIYQDSAQKFSFALTVRSLGTQLSTYSGLAEDREPLPFEIQIGLSKQLRYLPFRASLLYENVQRWNVLYDDPNAESGAILFGEEPQEPGKFAKSMDNLFRHLLFSGELLLGARENFRLRMAYRHRTRKELSAQGFGSAAGFSFGVGIKINRFRLDYGRSVYHLAGGSNHLGISTSLSAFRQKL